MAGRATLALYALDAPGQRTTAIVAFPNMAAIEGDHVIIHGRQIHAQAHGPLQTAALRTSVGDLYIAGDDAHMMEDGVAQGGYHTGNGIFHVDFQGVGFGFTVYIGGRQAGDFVLAGVDTIVLVADIGGAVTISIADRQGADPEITGAVAAVLHGGTVGSKGTVGVVGAERSGAPALISVRNSGIGNGRAVIDLQQPTGLVYPEQIAAVDGIQLKGFAGCVETNGHRIASLIV